MDGPRRAGRGRGAALLGRAGGRRGRGLGPEVSHPEHNWNNWKCHGKDGRVLLGEERRRNGKFRWAVYGGEGDSDRCRGGGGQGHRHGVKKKRVREMVHRGMKS